MKLDNQLEKSQQIAQVMAKLKKSVEAGVVKAMSTVEIPTLTIAEYIARVTTFEQRYTGDQFELFLDVIASKLVATYQEANLPNVLNFKLDEVNSRHMSILRVMVREIVEYKTLQQIRSTLDLEGLHGHLVPLFTTVVQERSASDFESAVTDIEAELAMCLTNNERKDSLEVEYRHRLAAFKQRAHESILKKCIGPYYIPVRWFTSDNLEDTLRLLVYVYITRDCTDDNIEFELCLKRFWYYNEADELRNETVYLLAEWRVIEWLRGELRPNVTPSDALDEAEPVSQPESKKKDQPPSVYITPTIRQALYEALSPYVDEDNHADLSTLIIKNKIPSNPIHYHCQQNSLAYLFRELFVAKNKLIMSTQNEISQWICTYFTPTTFDTIYDVIRGNKTPKNNRIEIKL